MPKNKALTKALFAPVRPDGNKKAQPISGRAGYDEDDCCQSLEEFYSFGGPVIGNKEWMPAFGKRYLELAAEYKRSIDDHESNPKKANHITATPLFKKIDALYSELKQVPAKKGSGQGTFWNSMWEFTEEVRVLNAEFKRIIASKDSGAAKTKSTTTNEVRSFSGGVEVRDGGASHPDGRPTADECKNFGVKKQPTEDQFEDCLDDMEAYLARTSGYIPKGRRDQPKESSTTTASAVPSTGRITMREVPFGREVLLVRVPEAEGKPKPKASGDSTLDDEEDSDSNNEVGAVPNVELQSPPSFRQNLEEMVKFGSADFSDEESMEPFCKNFLELASEYKRWIGVCKDDIGLGYYLIAVVNFLYSELKHIPPVAEQDEWSAFNHKLRVLIDEYKRIIASKDSGAAETKSPTTNDVIDVQSKGSDVAEKATAIDSDPMKKDSDANDDVVVWKGHIIKPESDDVTVEASTLKKESEAIDVNDEEEWYEEAEVGGFKPVCQCVIS